MTIGADADAILDALNRAINDLHSFVEGSLSIVEPYPVLLAQPPSSRESVAQSFLDAAQRLEGVAEACRAAGQRLTRALIAVERRQHDCQLALSPVSCLPPEILCRIFEFVLPPSSDPLVSHHPTVLGLSQVCSSWRRMAHAHQTLWTTIAITQHMPADVFGNHVALSNGKPLHLVVENKLPPLPFCAAPDSDDVWLGAMEALSWRAGQNPLRAILTQCHSLPALKSFELCKPWSCAACDDDGHAGDIFDGIDFPQLHDLTLKSINVHDVITIRAPLLTSLHLSSISVSAAGLGRLLQSLGTLEVLKLDSVQGIPFNNGGNAMTFTLPRLHSLAIINLELQPATHLMQPARYPALRHWEYTECFNYPASYRTPIVAIFLDFVKGCPKLETIHVWSGTRLIRALFRILHSNADMVPAPRPLAPAVPDLQTLSLSFAPEHGDPAEDHRQHKEEQREILVGLWRALEGREEDGIPRLDELTLPSCVATGGRIEYLDAIVGALSTVDCPCLDGYSSETESSREP